MSRWAFVGVWCCAHGGAHTCDDGAAPVSHPTLFFATGAAGSAPWWVYHGLETVESRIAVCFSCHQLLQCTHERRNLECERHGFVHALRAYVCT